jgi:hypothetical protein
VATIKPMGCSIQPKALSLNNKDIRKCNILERNGNEEKKEEKKENDRICSNTAGTDKQKLSRM